MSFLLCRIKKFSNQAHIGMQMSYPDRWSLWCNRWCWLIVFVVIRLKQFLNFHSKYLINSYFLVDWNYSIFCHSIGICLLSVNSFLTSFFQTCKRTYMRWRVRTDLEIDMEDMRPPKYIILLSSAFSSICGQVVSYPLALMRTKMQSKSSFSEERLNSLSGLFRKIVEEEGYRGLYRGFYPNMLKVLPAVMISFGTYEFLNEKLGLRSMGSK